MIIYGMERFIFEFYRGDPGRGEVFGGLMSGTQLIALGLVAGGFLIYLCRTPLRSFGAQASGAPGASATSASRV